MFCEHKKHEKEMAFKTIAYFFPRVFKFVCEVFVLFLEENNVTCPTCSSPHNVLL